MGSDAIAAYYDNLVDAYGHDPRAVDASSRESLETRYEVLAGVCDLDGKSILEVGCGFGDLGAYLLDRFDCVYRGIDISPRMIEEGRRVHPELDLRQGDILTTTPLIAHVVLAQGIFYKLGEDARHKTRAMVTRMFRFAEEAVAFTAISSWRSQTRNLNDEYRMDPYFALDLADSLTNKMTLRHDYHPGDLAMYLYR